MKKLKSIYVTGIVKDSKNNMEKYLFSENERLNAIIDELEERIDKAIDYIKKELIKNKNICSDVNDYNIYLDGMQKAYENCLEILGDKENE